MEKLNEEKSRIHFDFKKSEEKSEIWKAKKKQNLCGDDKIMKRGFNADNTLTHKKNDGNFEMASLGQADFYCTTLQKNFRPLLTDHFRQLDYNKIQMLIINKTTNQDAVKIVADQGVDLDLPTEVVNSVIDNSRILTTFSENDEIAYRLVIQQFLRSGWAVELSDEEAVKTQHVKVINSFSVKWKSDGSCRGILNDEQTYFEFNRKSQGAPSVYYPVVVGAKFFAKVDIKYATMHVDLSKKMQRYACFRDPITRKVYKCLKIIRGAQYATKIMQTISNVFCDFVTSKVKECQVICQSDDFLVMGQTYQACQQGLIMLKENLLDCGFELNLEKTSKNPEKKVEWSFHYLSQNTLEPIRKKQIQFKDDFRLAMNQPFFNSLHSLVTKLFNYSSTVAISAKPILLSLLSSFPSQITSLNRSEQNWLMCAPTHMFRKALSKSVQYVCAKGIRYKLFLHKDTYECYTDASLSKDGAYWGGIASKDGNYRYTIEMKGNLWDTLGLDFKKIYQLELFAVIVALNRAPSQCNLRIKCDNQTCIQGVSNQAGKDHVYMNMIRQLHLLAERKQINLVIKYVASKDNFADQPTKIVTNNFFSIEGTDPFTQAEIFQLSAESMTRHEAAAFRQGMFTISLPEGETIPLWKLKLLDVKKDGEEILYSTFVFALQSWNDLEIYIKRVLAHRLVTLVVKTNQMPRGILLDLAMQLQKEGHLRVVTPILTMDGELVWYLEYNENQILEPLGFQKDIDYEERRLFKKKGKIVLDLAPKVGVRLGSPEQLSYNNYFYKMRNKIPEWCYAKWEVLNEF